MLIFKHYSTWRIRHVENTFILGVNLASRSRLQIAKADITAYLDRRESRVLRLKDFGQILSQERAGWRLAVNTTSPHFIAFLKKLDLKEYELKFPHRSETLYVWKGVPTMEMLLHVKNKSYYSHYTAMRMHGLTEQIPTSIYITHERSNPYQEIEHEEIDQALIDAAFAQPARVTQNFAIFGDRRIVLINSAFTAQLGVEQRTTTFGTDGPAVVRVTNLERTLIEAAAKPWYSGGVAEVAKAFAAAKEEVSVNRLCATLTKLNYAYPYHQAIGYYMERADYRASQIDLVRSFPVNRNFYLDHTIPEPRYVKGWRLYVPAGFD